MKIRFTLPALMFVAGVAGFQYTAALAEPAATDMPSSAAEANATDNPAGFLGVAVAESLAPPAAGPNVPRTVLLISDVMPDSAAEAAGLRSGDVLLEIDGQVMLHPVQLRRFVEMLPAGREVEIAIFRDDKPQTLTATLGERPAELTQRLGQDLNPAPVPVPERREFDWDNLPGDAMPLDLEGDLRDMQQRMDRQFEQMRQMFRQGMDDGWPGGDMWERFDPIELDFNFQGLPGGQHVTVLQDQEHRLTVTQTADGRHLKATDLAGQVLYDGPIDTPEQLETVPQELRDKLPEPGQMNLRILPQLGPDGFFERLNPRPQPPADNDKPGEQLPAPAGRAV